MILSSLRNALLEVLPCNTAVVDTNGQIVLVNRAWRQFALDNGLPALDWSGVNYIDVCRKASPCPDAEATLVGFEALFAGRSARFVLEYPCHVPGGEQRWFELLAVPFESDSNSYIVTLHRPITERQLLKIELGQAQKMEAIGRLASGVAHDFNNLLMGIAGAANIGLKKTEPDSPLRYYFDEIKNAAVGGIAITNQLLAFSRKSGGSRSRQDLDEIVLGSEGMLRQLIGESIEFEIHTGCPDAAVLCGDGQIVQILMNLVVNARDAMAGSGVVTIATSPVDVDESSPPNLEPGHYCLLRVSDTGPGMDIETQRRIFEPFFTTKGVGAGTGLGLSSVYGIVRSAGGLIRVLSDLGHGTTFEIYLPWSEQEGPDVATCELEPPIGGAETVLLVEDEALVRETVHEYLSDAGYGVLIASDGDEARRACRRVDGAIDLLLTDMILPGTSGAEVAREIRGLAPGVAVVFMSAHPRQMLLDSGRVDVDDIVLHKPFDEEVLLRALREALGARTPPRPTCGPLLLVDDDELCREALVELFEAAGYTVIAAATAGEALGLASESGIEIGIMITDFKLPDFDGAELVARLAEHGLNPPVLYMSGRAVEEPKIAAALARPRTGFVQKPTEFERLLAAVQALTIDGVNGQP
jgi:signal transduction histidine kinase/DNA-binding response OmpR family regulator